MKSSTLAAGLLSALLAGCADDDTRNHAPTIDDLRVTFAGPLTWSVQISASDVDGDPLTWSLALAERPGGAFVTIGDEHRPLTAGRTTTVLFDDAGAPLADLRVEVSDARQARDRRVVQLGAATYLYYWDGTTRLLRAYSIDEDTCAFALVDTEPGPTHVGRGGLGADPLARFIYLGDTSARQIRSHAVDPRDGSLAAPRSSSYHDSILVASGPLAATDSHVFMATTGYRCCAHGSLHGFVLDAASGALRELPDFCPLDDPSFVALDASGRRLFTAGTAATQYIAQLATYELRDNGSMMPLFIETLRGETSGGARGGEAVFVIVDGRLSAWRIAPDTGRLTPVAGTFPVAWRLATDPRGRRLALLGEELALYAIETPSLALRLADSLPVAAERTRARVALSPSTRLLLFDNGAGEQRLFRWNERTARLDACAAPTGGYDPAAPRPNEFVFVRLGRAEPR